MEFHRPDPDPVHPGVVMAGSGEALTHGRLRARVNRLAHLLRAAGLRRGDHFAIFMENHQRYIECGRAGMRSGLYFTNINCYLSPGELAYILNNSQSQVLITSQSRRTAALEALVCGGAIVGHGAAAWCVAWRRKTRPPLRRSLFEL
jgi:long-chain acyl-CoA synthetase